MKRNSKKSNPHPPSNIPNASSFNDYFVNVGKSLSDSTKAPPSHFSDYLPPTNGQLFTLKPTTVDAILTLIKNSRETAAGYDHLPMFLIKKDSIHARSSHHSCI